MSIHLHILALMALREEAKALSLPRPSSEMVFSNNVSIPLLSFCPLINTDGQQDNPWGQNL